MQIINSNICFANQFFLFFIVLNSIHHGQYQCLVYFQIILILIIQIINKITNIIVHIIVTISSTSSVWSLNNLSLSQNQINEQELKSNHFEPLPFLDAPNQTKKNNYPQLSQKHTIIKQSIEFFFLISFLNLNIYEI